MYFWCGLICLASLSYVIDPKFLFVSRAEETSALLAEAEHKSLRRKNILLIQLGAIWVDVKSACLGWWRSYVGREPAGSWVGVNCFGGIWIL